MAEVAPTGAERSLDDFFAKRDKKKKKEKCRGREPASAPGPAALRRGKREKAAKSDSPDAQLQKEDEKWNDFEQKEVDYSGLRVQALQLSDVKEGEDYDKEELGEDGQVLVCSGDRAVGPWNKPSAAPPVAAPVEEVEVVEQKPAGVYRPPGARQTGPKRGTVQGPPEIFNDAQFPSLLSTAKHVETHKDREVEKTFEVVKHRNRVREEVDGASLQQLQLDNQYAILGDK